MWLKNLTTSNRDLFPTKWSFVIFITYMALFVSQGLLVTASRRGGKTYPYNPTTVVLVTEFIKLIIAASTYLCKNSFPSLLKDLVRHRVVGLYYFVPATLYCLYNNLSFQNLSFFDPTTYFIFMQIRLLMTGVIYQFLFQRRLSGKQWLSLFILTCGCMLQAMDVSGVKKSDSPVEGVNVSSISDLWMLIRASPGVALILIQVCCSVFAGVYNEYIIKKVGSDVDIMIQNVYMYIDSIVCNVFALSLQKIVQPESSESGFLTAESFKSMFQIFVIAIILNNSMVGIVTSLFLKNLNSIVKAFASALELVFTAMLSFVLLGIPIYWNTVVAVVIVAYAVVMYAKNPIKSPESKNHSLTKKEVPFKKLVKFQKEIEEKHHLNV